MSIRKQVRTAVALVGSAVIVFGAVWAASASPSEDQPRVAVNNAPTAKISAFKRKFTPTRAQRVQRRAIKRQIRRSPRTSIAASADSSRSRPVPVAGFDASVWIMPADDGAVCTFIPDPVDGWGASCATAEEVADGSAVTLLGGWSTGPLADAAIVAVVVPDRSEGPTLERPDGSVAAIDVNSNVAAAVVPPGALVRSGRVTVTVPNSPPSNCSPRADGEGSAAGTYLQCAP